MVSDLMYLNGISGLLSEYIVSIEHTGTLFDKQKSLTYI